MVVRVKGNQPGLLAEAQRIAQRTAVEPPFITYEHSHGRMELRDTTVFQIRAGDFSGEWNGLFQSVVVVFRQTTMRDRHGLWHQRTETAYYLATTKFDAKTSASVIRRHWGIENRLHHVRDVTMKEDASRTRNNPGIFARIRSFALNIMRKNKLSNISDAIFENSLNLRRVLQFKGVY